MSDEAVVVRRTEEARRGRRRGRARLVLPQGIALARSPIGQSILTAPLDGTASPWAARAR